jgi:hypothetical protein
MRNYYTCSECGRVVEYKVTQTDDFVAGVLKGLFLQSVQAAMVACDRGKACPLKRAMRQDAKRRRKVILIFLAVLAFGGLFLFLALRQ